MKKTTDSPVGDEPAALCGRAWDVLVPARASYLADVSAHYDEVFHEVAQRTEHTGSLGKTDIAALVVWKRLSAQTRWVTELMSLPDTQVRKVTKQAVTKVRDTTLSPGEAARAGRAIISQLPGFHKGDALASAVLTAAAPQRMAVYDRRVYGRYLQLLDDLLHHGGTRADGWTARDIDTALYSTGATPDHPASP
ncbi:hypothetical protein ACFY20_39880 [Streptomyces sp. NPDC001312]|uniref:hypothetical protein n=1 Tax=Streptomyces sp. NPDC001312 TaxID=3364561 RepID=UPI003680FA58